MFDSFHSKCISSSQSNTNKLKLFLSFSKIWWSRYTPSCNKCDLYWLQCILCLKRFWPVEQVLCILWERVFEKVLIFWV
jgi:hypothetical protein